MASRLAWVTLSLSLVLSLGMLRSSSYAQGDAKKDAPAAKPAPAAAPAAVAPAPAPAAAVPAPAPAPATPDASKKDAAAKPAEPAKTEPAKAAEPTKAAEAPLPTIPPEVEAKLQAARRAVAEAIVAAQDAGLVETSIDPPPILDILITGRAIDGRTVKKTGGTPPFAVSPEVFGAWFTGYGKTEGVNYQKDVRVLPPSAGLKQWYDQRASILNAQIEAVRKAKAPAPEPKKPEVKPEPKKEETKPEVKKEEAKPEPKK